MQLWASTKKAGLVWRPRIVDLGALLCKEPCVMLLDEVGSHFNSWKELQMGSLGQSDLKV